MVAKEISLDDVDDAFALIRLKWLEMSGENFDRSQLQTMKKQVAGHIVELAEGISNWNPKDTQRATD